MPERTMRAFWTRWTVAYALGWIVGGAFSASMLPALVGWGLVGLIQWLVIRTALPHMGAWIVLSALGGAIGIGTFAATEVLLQRYDPQTLWDAMENPRTEVAPSADTSRRPSSPTGPTRRRPPALWVWPLAGGVVGMAMGTAQWILLRRRLVGAAWWIPANLVAWSAGSVLVGVTMLPTLSQLGEARITVWGVVPLVAVGGACTGAISGGALVALLWRRGTEPGASPPSVSW